MSISPDVFRAGKRYRLVNFGDVYEFTVERFAGSDDYILKDIHTLERYRFLDLLRYGKSKDYDLYEIDE